MKAHNNEEIGNKMNNSKRKIKNSKNKTVKTRDNNKPMLSQSLINLSKVQRDIVCKNYFNKYDTFEDKIEELFKKNKINLESTIYELDKKPQMYQVSRHKVTSIHTLMING